MMTEHHRRQPPSLPPSAASGDGPLTSSSSVSTSQLEEETNEPLQNQDIFPTSLPHHHHREQFPPPPPPSGGGLSYRFNISISDVGDMRDDIWSCLILLLTFWCFASMTLILGLFGSETLQLGPNCSRLMKTNPLFVQSIKAEMVDDPKSGPVLYGFYEHPSLDIQINWTQTHKAFVQTDFHKEWVYFLNKGSMVEIFYNVTSLSALPLSLVIAQGRESLVEWINDPSYPNTTLSWNIISGSGKIQQEILKSSSYYIAVGNLNSEEAEVELKFAMKTFIYNTTQAYYKCSLRNHLCSLKVLLLRTSVAVLTSPSPDEGASNDDWYVKLSYGPRWITYLVGSGVLTVLILLVLKFCSIFQNSNRGDEYQVREVESEQAPLLPHKDDDVSSWGSSYDSNSQNEEDLDQYFAVNSLEGKTSAEGENPHRLCVICFDAPRDCFFLPCGHCAACFTCGARTMEEAGTCPICRRSTKKVRKIFSV